MNIPDLLRLKAWLEAGAPDVIFNMDFDQKRPDELLPSELEDHLEASSQTQKHDCGTVCCIAGAAELMSRDSNEPHPSRDWQVIGRRALTWLGLEDNPGNFMRHPLFDPRLAPDHCSPDQAAEAVQRVIDGKNPWPDA